MNAQIITQPARRPKGEGSITYISKTKNYAVRLTYGKNKDGTPDRRTKTAKNEKEAKQLLKSMKKERDSTLGFTISNLTVDEYFNKWLLIKKLEISESSHIRLRYSVEYIIKRIGSLQIRHVTADHCQDIIFEMIENEYSHSSIKKIYNTLNACFRYAMEREDLIRSPMIGVVAPSSDSEAIKEAKEMEPFTLYECKKFLDEAVRRHMNGSYVYRLGLMFQLMLSTGIRTGEALALCWDDVDWENRTIYIWKTQVTSEEKNPDTGKNRKVAKIVKRTKNKRRRKIDLNESAYNALTELRKITGQYEYIASTKSGELVTYANLYKVFHRVLNRIGLPLRGLHNLRHTFASQLFAKGVDAIVVSKILGHCSVTVTSDIYIHVLTEQKEAAVRVLDFLKD